MAVLKCKACGAPLETVQGEQVVKCGYCNLQQTIPQMDDEFKLQMFNQANDLRRQFDFDGAKSFLQAIISQHPEEAEAYWNICLCKYGIMYVEDQQTLARIPTFYRMIPQSILSDEDYLKACKFAGAASWKYEEEAQRIDKLQKKILELSNSDEPYDIFICYKKTDLETGLQTEDSKIASQIYMKLIENNYRVFWAERSLPAGCEYEPYIYAALSTAKIMLVLSSDKRYFEAEWVKNEWIRFLDMMSRDSNKTIMTCYKNISAEDIPMNLRSLQALDMNSMLFSSDLLERIQKKIPKKKNELDTDTLFNAFKSFQAANEEKSSTSQAKEIAFGGGVYLGDAIAGKPHGVGTYHLPNGDRYEGNWNVGNMHGQGTFYYSNGDSWTGEWNNGVAWNGTGKYSKKDNNSVWCYEGELRGGALFGQGKVYVNGNISREGNFENGKLEGQGIAYIKTDVCKGEFKQGKPWDADGLFISNAIPKKPLMFNGHWQDGQPCGKGIFHSPDKSERIEGIFTNGMNGEVIWYYANGQRYEGNIQSGLRTGNGKLIASNGNLIYQGCWQNDMANGQGIQYFANGKRRYEGQFADNKFNGQGTFYYEQGSWTGEWKDGARWKGQGLLMFFDDKGNPTGKFFNGHMVNGKAAGKGILRFEDGSRYDGEFLNDNYYNGVVYNAANQIVDTYVNGESQQQKAHNRNQAIAGTALGILKGLSGL